MHVHYIPCCKELISASGCNMWLNVTVWLAGNENSQPKLMMGGGYRKCQVSAHPRTRGALDKNRAPLPFLGWLLLLTFQPTSGWRKRADIFRESRVSLKTRRISESCWFKWKHTKGLKCRIKVVEDVCFTRREKSGTEGGQWNQGEGGGEGEAKEEKWSGHSEIVTLHSEL